MPSIDVAKLSVELAKLLTGVKLNRKGDDIVYNYRTVPYEKGFATFLQTTLHQESINQLRAQFPDFQYIGLMPDVLRELRLSLLKVKTEEKQAAKETLESDLSTIHFNDSIKAPLSETLLILNVANLDDSRLYDDVNDVAYTYDMKLITQTISRLLFDEDVRGRWYATNTRQAIHIYAPYKERMFQDPSGHWCFNTWNKPSWQIGWEPDPTVTQLPEETEEFFNLLTGGSEESKKHLLSWVYSAMWEPYAEPILILRGEPGCGKSMLIEGLAAALIGKDGSAKNFTKGTRQVAKSAFLGYLGRCKLALFEEVTVGDEFRETLKDFHNDQNTFEDKFKNVETPSRRFASIAVTQNRKRKIKLEYSDRKFYVPELGHVDLRKIKGKEWCDTLAKTLWSDDAYLRTVASYIYNCAARSTIYPETKSFLEICWYALPAYMRRFISLCVNFQEFDSKKFYLHCPVGTRRIEVDTLLESIEAYEMHRGVKLCDFKLVDSPLKSAAQWRVTSNLYTLPNKKDFVLHDIGFDGDEYYDSTLDIGAGQVG